MKLNNIFKNTTRNSSLFLAGVLAFTIAACDSDVKSDQSIVREAENIYEDEPLDTEDGEGVPLEDGNTAVADEDSYDYNREYAYEERDIVIQRVRDDLGRAEESLSQLEERIQAEGEGLSEDARREMDEARQVLEQRRTELGEELETLERSSAADWENVRNNANETLLGFQQEWEELKNRDLGLGETGEEYDAEPGLDEQ